MVMTTEVLRNMLYERSDTLERPGQRRDGRGPLPPGPLPRRCLGGGPDPSAAERQRRVPVRHDLQRRRVRRMDRHVAGRDAGHHRGEASRPARAPLPRRSRHAPDARGAGRRRPSEPVRRVARPARAAHEDLLPAGERGRPTAADRSRPREGHRRVYKPRREEVVDVLDEQDMLPAIYFVFSRAGCDRSVRLDAGSRAARSPRVPRPNTSANAPRRAPLGSTRKTS